MQAQDLAGHPRGLVPLVLGPVPLDRLSAVAHGEELLGLASDVVGDHGVGGVEDRLGRAEVLLEQNRRHVGKGPLELQDVADVGPAPAVDRLVGVADHAHVAVGLAQQLDDLVLGVVGVLELVDQNVAEALLVGGPHVVEGLEQVGRHHQEVVEVERVGRVQAVLVLRVDLGDALAEGVGPAARLLAERLEVDQLRLGLADDALHRPRGQALLVVAELGRDHLDQPARVGVVVDGEGAAVAEAVGVGAQNAQAGRVEGRDPHFVGRRAHQLGHPAAHLVRRLVGEGDGQDAPGRGVARRHQVGDAPGQHPGLARAGTGHDQQRPAPVLDRGPLGQRQVVDQGGGIAGEGSLLGGRALRRRRPSSAPSTATASAPTSLEASGVGSLGRLDLRRGGRCPEALVRGVEELLGPATARPRG